MKTYNIYTEILQEIASYNKRISTATANSTDHIKAQQLRDSLFDYEHKGYITWNERKILYPLVDKMVDDIKEVIKLNEDIKQIHKEIEAERRKQSA